MTTLEIKQLMELAKQYGVEKLKFQEIELQFFPNPPPLSIPFTIPESELTPKNVELSDEDMLFYSADASK